VRAKQLSYRRRRRLLWLTVLAVVAGGVAIAIVVLPHGDKIDRGPTVPPPQALSAAKHVPRQMHLTTADQHGLRSTIALFVSTSVARHHPERSWAIVHPVMREGISKRQWSTGNIPVVPFPAAGVDLFTLQSAADEKVLAEVLLEPPPKSTLVRKTFQIELRRAPQARYGWFVTAWVPEGVSDSQISRDASTEPVVASHAQHLSAIWLVALVSVLGGSLILIPTGMLVRDAFQSHRAMRRVRRRPEPDRWRP
jgi:hypothetical protein